MVFRHLELEAHKVILWKPTHRHRIQGRSRNFLHQGLQKDHGLESTDALATLMPDRFTWKSCTRASLWTTEWVIVFNWPVWMARSVVPSRGAIVCPGLDSREAVPNTSADTACLRRWRTQSSSTRSLITRLRSLQVPSVNTRLLSWRWVQ